ncbi:MAG: transcriptional repressor [Clostridia bacterium]|nr:transcriptional repressor [Clostridia bacterium]
MTTADHAARLQAHGVRPTPQRLAVYEYLLTHRTHPSADAIYEAISPVYPTFSRTTIYNSLKALMDAGLIRVVTIDPLEQHFDGDAADHGHCRCQQCGRLFDFEIPAKTIADLIPDGFRVSQQDVFFTGLCKDCAE